MEENLKFDYLNNEHTVWDKNRLDGNDYLRLAVINTDGSTVTFFEEVSEQAKKKILFKASQTYNFCHQRIPAGNLERLAIVFYSEFEKNVVRLGVQFWTPEMIDAGSSPNTDGTTAYYVAMYRHFKKGDKHSPVKIYDVDNHNDNKFAVDDGKGQTYQFKTFSEAVDFFNGVGDKKIIRQIGKLEDLAGIFTRSEIKSLYNFLQFEVVYRDSRVSYINGILNERFGLVDLVKDLRKDIRMLEELDENDVLIKEYKSIITKFALHFGIPGTTPYHYNP